MGVRYKREGIYPQILRQQNDFLFSRKINKHYVDKEFRAERLYPNIVFRSNGEYIYDPFRKGIRDLYIGDTSLLNKKERNPPTTINYVLYFVFALMLVKLWLL